MKKIFFQFNCINEKIEYNENGITEMVIFLGITKLQHFYTPLQYVQENSWIANLIILLIFVSDAVIYYIFF